MLKKALIVIAICVVVSLGSAFLLGIYPLSYGWHKAMLEEDGVAIKGYDPVAYFKDGEALIGQKGLSHRYDGLLWCFADSLNWLTFQSCPKDYLPRYEALCPYAIAQGIASPGDPEVWDIIDGRLYFFADRGSKEDWYEFEYIHIDLSLIHI